MPVPLRLPHLRACVSRRMQEMGDKQTPLLMPNLLPPPQVNRSHL